MGVTVIDSQGDLTIQVIEYDDKTLNEKEEKAVLGKSEFLVSRAVLTKNSSYFAVMLQGTRFVEARKSFITMHEDTVASIELWLRVLHGAELSYDQSLPEIWNIADACDKYHFDLKLLKPWYGRWYEKYDIEKLYKNSDVDEMSKGKSGVLDPCALLYPCWILDHAKGFARATRFLAYNRTGHIMEINPSKHKRLHLDPLIIQQLNAAKGRLRTILHSGLFRPNEKLLQATCKCKEITLWNYEEALYTIQVWPLERVFQRATMTTILNRLDNFEFEATKSACLSCRANYKTAVEKAQSTTEESFHGLCLDCMDRTKSVTEDEHMDYWRHNELREGSFGDCRVKHGQPTWYFSFMGRRWIRDRFLKMRRSAKH